MTTIRPYKFDVGTTVQRFGSRVKVVKAFRSEFGTNCYEVEEVYMGNVSTVTVWESELNYIPNR